MELKGYGGSIVVINLSTGEINRKSTNFALASNYIGGYGIAYKLAYDFLQPNTDPWSPNAPIVISPGFLNGTLSPSSSKVCMVTKDPASNTISSWYGSLHFGAKLKWAGIDGLVIIGKSPKPVYIKILDDNIEICDAADLWGITDTFDTVDVLRERHGNSCSVVAIGPAGENLVKISMLFIDKGTTWGRAAGSTWGSKNLKALVVNGTNGVEIADMGKFIGIVDNLFIRAMKDPLRKEWKDKGLQLIAPLWEQAGYISAKNWNETAPKDIMMGPLGVESYMKHKVRVYGCPTCVAPDKHIVKIQGSDSKEYMSPISTPIDPGGSFGARLEIYDINDCLKLQDVANRFGIDEMTFTAMVSWAIELFRQGILTSDDTGGIELKEGFEVAYKLLTQTRDNKDFGAVLASGFKDAIKKIGKNAGIYAYEIKGTEPDLDARGSLGIETFTSVVNVRPARDLPIGGLTIAKGRDPSFFQKVFKKMGYVPAERFDNIITPTGFDLPRLAAYYEYWGTILDMMGICFRMQSSSLWHIDTVVSLYSAATGIQKTAAALLKDAERAFNLSKFLNVREGLSRVDDKFPPKWFQPLKRPDRGEELVMINYFGEKKITLEDTEKMLSDYYDEHGWDISKGVPTITKLKELGLEDAANELSALNL